ncbi:MULTISPECIES: putative PEP-binding protein [Actinoalloteichus]|uniref:Phosphoenolpyruvate-protein phosphotransferase n=1 Tax=Actinoalloteichus fjordicus TaxID=1612552 RepID=A0AAC9PUS7_9PSEU|nr:MULTISPECIES: putative PEP-binding protein [Actinoalloteichus]APU18019.1 phosphoenolpyruvate-protein kinase (PTS system EI component) [Actinoalloteichus fjordicus]APU24098.1 phosphoenolpyruvate-protein kinase (PTS system EI component) [Actinoalloteichus sp. GBA129-24]
MAVTGLQGVGVSAGRAAGPMVRVADPLPPPESGPAPADPAEEAARIRPVAEAVAAELSARAGRADGEPRAVLETTAAMAADPALIASAETLVVQRGLPAPRAVYEAAGTFADDLRALGGYLGERARDVLDVRDRLVAELSGVRPPGVPVLEAPGVLVARDLAPADTADLDPALVLALVTEEGGPTSHTAILARALRIPAVVGCRGALELAEPVGLIVDGDTGLVQVQTGEISVQAVDRAAEPSWTGPGHTSDGDPIPLLANVGSVTDAATAVAAGAEGVGLFRTEFCYLDAETEPTEAAQRAAYAEVLAAFAGLPVVVRTLDAGSDKPLPFLSGSSAEPNPALGVRGLRIGREEVGVLDRQLAAIAGAQADSGASVSVMAPMVATAEEADWFATRARAAGLNRVGVMIEVPAAVLTAQEVFGSVDFVSVGTNDLAQYVFAADRMLGSLAGLNDPWQPALLRLLALLGRAARETGTPVGVCGEAAGDPLLAAVLVGLGATSLSMAAGSLASVGNRLASISRAHCIAAGQAALLGTDPASVRAAVVESISAAFDGAPRHEGDRPAAER